MPADKCPICGVPGHACGPAGTGTPISFPALGKMAARPARRDGPVERNRYNVVINGVQTQLTLTAEGAKARGLTDKDIDRPASEKADKPANKAATPANKGRR